MKRTPSGPQGDFEEEKTVVTGAPDFSEGEPQIVAEPAKHKLFGEGVNAETAVSVELLERTVFDLILASLPSESREAWRELHEEAYIHLLSDDNVFFQKMRELGERVLFDENPGKGPGRKSLAPEERVVDRSRTAAAVSAVAELRRAVEEFARMPKKERLEKKYADVRRDIYVTNLRRRIEEMEKIGTAATSIEAEKAELARVLAGGAVEEPPQPSDAAELERAIRQSLGTVEEFEEQKRQKAYLEHFGDLGLDIPESGADPEEKTKGGPKKKDNDA